MSIWASKALVAAPRLLEVPLAGENPEQSEPEEDHWSPIEPGSFEFWLPLLVTLAAHFIVFFIAQIRKDNGILDVQWGLSFIIGNASVLIARISKGGAKDNLDARMIVSNLLVLTWGLRMAIHVFLRTERGKEDRRFAKIREKLMNAGGPVLYYCVAFFGIFMFNGCAITAINASALWISMRSKGGPLEWTDYLGILVWLIGFSILTVADH